MLVKELIELLEKEHPYTEVRIGEKHTFIDGATHYNQSVIADTITIDQKDRGSLKDNGPLILIRGN